MELIAIAAIIALAALAGGKKNGNGSRFDEGTDDGSDRFKGKAVNGNDAQDADFGDQAGEDQTKKWQGPVPNMSGDAAGYNTNRFPSTISVCQAAGVLGYNWAPNNPPGCNDPWLLADSQLKKNVKKFQRDYNKISRIPGWGGIKGSLVEDGKVGPQTKNAIEHAELLGFPWQAVVGGLPPP